MAETLFAFSNDDAGTQEPDLFAEMLDFLDEQHVPATFFVVPNAGNVRLDQKPVWRALLDRSLDSGHELQHHAYRHDSCFEFGVPPDFMIDILPVEIQDAYARSPEQFTQAHGYETLRDKLEKGREILTRVLDYVPRGFRAPCLSMCDNTYRALHDLDFEWSSNLVVNPMGWRYINHDYDRNEPWAADVPPRPFRSKEQVTEVPMLSEYTWYLTSDDVDRHFALIQADYDRVRAERGAFIVLSHYYAMGGKWSAGQEVYRRLFDYAREKGDVRFVTISQLVTEYGDRSAPSGQ